MEIGKVMLTKIWRIIAFVATVGVPAWVITTQDYFVDLLKDVSDVWIVRIFAVLLGVLIFLISWMLLNRPWLRWDEPTGTWISRITSTRYCEKCRAKKILTPLKNEITGWRCMSCERFYSDPKRREKNKPPETNKRERIQP